MDEKLYELMDWAGVEAIVYSEEDQPQNLLGAHVTEDGITIQDFSPEPEKWRSGLTAEKRDTRWTLRMKQGILQY